MNVVEESMRNVRCGVGEWNVQVSFKIKTYFCSRKACSRWKRIDILLSIQVASLQNVCKHLGLICTLPMVKQGSESQLKKWQ